MGDADLLAKVKFFCRKVMMRVSLHSVESDLIVTILLAFVSISHTRYDA